MADIGMRGTNSTQDSRFKDKEAASIKATKFPKHFDQKVDLRKVNISVLRNWIAQKVTELIKIEDDVVVEYVFGMLEDKEKPIPDPRKMQVNLVGFMDKHGAAAFMDQLWTLLLSAQQTVGGVPAEFIAAKKAELEQKQNSQPNLQEQMMARSGRAAAADSFDRPPRRDIGLPERPGRDGRGFAPRERDSGYGQRGPPRERDSGYGQRGPPRERDSGYGQREPGYGQGGMRGDDQRGGRNEEQGRGYGRRRSPTPTGRGYRRDDSPPARRREPPPRRGSPSPPPRRRRSSSPRRDRDQHRARSITPPLRHRRVPSRERERETYQEDTPPRRRRRSPTPDSSSPSPPPRRSRAESRSRTPTPSDPRPDSRSRSRSRSPTVTPPRRGRHDSTPPRRRQDSTPPRRRREVEDVTDSPPPKRRRESPQRREDREERLANQDELVVKKGRGFDKARELEGPLKSSRWA